MDRVLLLEFVALLALLGGGTLASASCGGCSSGRERRDIVFPGDDDLEVDPVSRYLSSEQIERLNNLETAEEVSHSFSNASDGVEEPIVGARIFAGQTSLPGSRGEARNPIVRKAVNAKCQPMLQVVPLKKPDDLRHVYWPHCIQLERCGGCCVNDRQHSCQPTVTELVPIRVDRYLLQPNGMRKVGEDTLYEEVHKKCKCQCILKAENCSNLQEYLPNECRCKCANSDEKSKCLAQNFKQWDNSSCRCQCKEIIDNCTTGLYFDFTTCSCTAMPGSTATRRHPDNSYKVDNTRRRRWQNRTRTASPATSPLP